MTTSTDKQPTRRGFIDYLVAVGACITGVAVTIPGLMYLWPAARGGGADNVEVEGAEALAPGQSLTLQMGDKVVIVVRQRNGYRAFSASCTHLGCLVTWAPAKKEFLCPCHAAVFDKDGKVVSGPPPAPLPTFKVKEVGGKVFVSAA